MKNRLPITLVALLSLSTAACTNGTEDNRPTLSPYAGEEMRAIKSLSQDRVAGLLAGDGLGYAKVAELNGFPGPKHVLELANELDLSTHQLAQTRTVFEKMNAAARHLGADLVGIERHLDSLFAAGSVDSSSALSAMRRAGDLEARLRWAHVEAHLRQTEILSRHQRRLYAQLRGYDANGGHEHDPSHEHSDGT